MAKVIVTTSSQYDYLQLYVSYALTALCFPSRCIYIYIYIYTCIYYTTGTYVWKNGDKYFGHFKDMKRNGYGKLLLHNGNFYEGEFKGTIYIPKQISIPKPIEYIYPHNTFFI